MKNLIAITIFLILEFIVVFETVTLGRIMVNAYNQFEADLNIRVIAERTCHPFAYSTWFKRNEQLFIVCETDVPNKIFSIEAAKYEDFL